MYLPDFENMTYPQPLGVQYYLDASQLPLTHSPLPGYGRPI